MPSVALSVGGEGIPVHKKNARQRGGGGGGRRWKVGRREGSRDDVMLLPRQMLIERELYKKASLGYVCWGFQLSFDTLFASLFVFCLRPSRKMYRTRGILCL